MKRAQQPKVYAIKSEPSTSHDVKGKGVLEGTFDLNGIDVRVLFDTGASNSFISSGTVGKFRFTPKISPNPTCVTNPIGGKTE